jgi:hypothetical protein
MMDCTDMLTQDNEDMLTQDNEDMLTQDDVDILPPLSPVLFRQNAVIQNQQELAIPQLVRQDPFEQQFFVLENNAQNKNN